MMNSFSFPNRKCQLKGLHNIENILAALAAISDLGISERGVADTLAGFMPLPHRLQCVPTKRHVEVYDDSKATTIQSICRAVESFEGQGT
ncbi:MAG: hypothetical protein ACMUJM_17920 [bacterium]